MGIGEAGNTGSISTRENNDPFRPPETSWSHPPVGIMPRYIWLTQRSRELIATLQRYSAHELIDNIGLISEWATELNDVISDLMQALPPELQPR